MKYNIRRKTDMVITIENIKRLPLGTVLLSDKTCLGNTSNLIPRLYIISYYGEYASIS